MNIENQINGSIDRERIAKTLTAADQTMPEYLDQLADDSIEAGMDATGADIKVAADEIRKLTLKVDHMAAAMAEVASREDQLASALFGLVEDRVQSLVESVVDYSIDNYDPTDHYNFADAVAEHSGEPDEDRTRDIVREVIEGGSFTFHV